MALQGQQQANDPNDPLNAAAATLANAKAIADEMKVGTAAQTKLDQDRQDLPGILDTAQQNVSAAQRDRLALLAALASARADLTNCQAALATANTELAKQSKLPNGQSLPPGTYVSAKAAIGMLFVGAIVGAGGGAIATKIIIDNDKKKENGTSLEKKP